MSGSWRVLVRRLEQSDIPGALRLSATAGWNQTAEDWSRLLTLGADGCFGIEAEGVLAATATTVCYGTELAWIGMVLTAPEYRGRGYARMLMLHVLAQIRERGVHCVKLDASDMGRPLYEQLGFIVECPVERWLRSAAPHLGDAPELVTGDIDLALDRDAFGADRARLLEQLGRIDSAVAPGGYAMARPGREAGYFGPCVAGSRDIAEELLAWFLDRYGDRAAYWDVLPDNTDAVDLARSSGFSPVRRLTRMAYGRNRSQFASSASKVFAIAGFEYG